MKPEVCKRRWSWKIPAPEFGASVSLTLSDSGGRSESPGMKKGEDRLAVPNGQAQAVNARRKNGN